MSEYNYDENGQFFPFFILTLVSLLTFPLTYNVLKKNEEIESTAPRIQSDYKPKHDDLIRAQQRAQKRKEFKLKRTIAVVIGYLVMAWMVYKIIVTKRITPDIWDPYDILGLSRVCGVLILLSLTPSLFSNLLLLPSILMSGTTRAPVRKRSKGTRD